MPTKKSSMKLKMKPDMVTGPQNTPPQEVKLGKGKSMPTGKKVKTMAMQKMKKGPK